MSQLINFVDFNPKEAMSKKAVLPSDRESITASMHTEIDLEAKYKLTLTILVHNHPGKECFIIKEVAEKLGVGEEFIRRRIKSEEIKATYLGDKPFINIVELARIITEGV